jgi:signal transduction histidine kinase
MCNQAMTMFTKEKADMFVVPDLKADSRFRSHESVTGPPHHRFYVSVPIKSPDSYVIGSVAVLDDKPRECITDQQGYFLKELSVTVMDHLLSQRAMREEYREEKMVRALGLFVQGKSDLSEGIDSRRGTDNKLDHVNQKLEQIKLSSGRESQEAGAGRGRPSETSEDIPVDGEVENAELARSRSPVHKFKRDENEPDQPQEQKEENDQRPALSPTTSHLQKSLAPSNVQFVLNRASCLMDQALDVEGAMFIDATVYARRQMIGADGDDQEEPAMSAFEQEGQEYEDDDVNGPKSLVLGYSTSLASSRDDNQRESHYVSLPGGFVTHLIDRYPRGKIFHIEKDGSVALSYEGLSDEVSQMYVGGSKLVKDGSPKEKDLRKETLELKQLHKILPDARCIAIYPVWDFQRGRWFTVNLVWSNDPGRVLCEPKDLTYMAAFSNTVMAEVSRMDLEAADRAKSDFISSISHELRSPLHGVLGTVELLQETATTFTQRGLVETVYSCGRTLLDTLNHLLDYAKINTLMTGQSPGQEDQQAANPGSNVALPGLVQNEDLSALVQEVVEGLLAGAEFYNRETDSAPERTKKESRRVSSSSMGSEDRRIMTIVDVEWQDSWSYPVYAGAWRRVVMNLFGNALKYTQTGYIRLFMKMDTMKTSNNDSVPAVCITISDSGRGMSQDFLLHHLYIPFLQEDTQAPGLGVGLHLVHQIVKSLNGRIHFRSVVGKGTDVDVILPIPESKPTQSPPSPYIDLRERLKGMTVSFFTQSFTRDNLGIRPEVFDEIRSTLSRMVGEWFGLKVLSPDELQQQKADFLIVTEHEYRSLVHQSTESDVRSLVKSKTSFPLIVLSAQASSWKVVKESNQDRAIFLSQP